MIVSTQITMDLSHRGNTPVVYAVQGDKNSRVIKMLLTAGGMPVVLPDSVLGVVRFQKPDKTGGAYDALPNGTPAVSKAGDALIIALAEQMLTVPGSVEAQVELIDQDKHLATFTFSVAVQADPSVGAMDSEDYFNLTQYVTKEVEKIISAGGGSVGTVTKISELENDVGYVTAAVSDLQNYYKKGEVYTQGETRALLSQIPKFAIRVVSALPSSNISETTVYLVAGGNGSDLYTEYIYVGGKWEILGSQKIDLSNYLEKDELQGAIDQALEIAKQSGEFDGEDGISVTSVEQIYGTDADGGENVVEVTLSDGTKSYFVVYNGRQGQKGNAGNGIASTVLNDDYTLTINFDNGTKYNTPSIRGAKGDKGDKGDSGADGSAGKDGASVTVTNVSESTADGGSNVVTFSDGKTLTVKNGSKGSKGDKGDTGAAGKDYTFDPTVYGLPVLYLTGDTTGMSNDVAVTLNWAYGENGGSCTLKWQGSSSLAYEKKNYTIKLDTAIEVVDGWGSQKKYCLKANYIDHTHARNIVSARLWGQVVASRSSIYSNLKNCPNYGAVDGFPIAIVLNGEFHGLYTWNIPKDAWMFGMGSGTQEAVICADDATYPAVDLRVHSNVNGDDHELEYVTNENSTAWVATSLNRVIDALVNSYGADLDTTIAQYLDWESAIDYYIFTVIMDGRDMTGKNYIMATWNGTKWVWSAYDMDSTYGLDWNGATLLSPNEGVTFESFRKNRVMELVYRFKTNALKARYKKLRETVLSEYAINLAFENFGCGIPSVLLDEDAKKWTSIPSTSVNSTDQILRWLHHRLAIVDKWIEAIPAQETPVAPSNRTGNVVSVSTDASGSIFNDTGYKDGYTINTADGGDTEVATPGCCITGFIPVTKNNVIKVTTDHWNISPTNSRIIFYDMDLKPMAYYTQHGFVGLFNGYTNKTAILAKESQSVTYNADGTTTLNIAYGANCTNLGYIRIRGVGKGANLAVIREGEIPEHAPDFEPEVVIDNWIPVSTDANGAIYNSVGYKDNTRTKTDTPDEEETKTGMFQTGFIPFKMTDILRVSSSAWGTSPSNAKVLICNAQFKAMAYYTANGYIGVFNGYTTGAESNVTSLKDKNFQSVTKGDDGFTTINLTYGKECTDVAYVRITGCGSGANAVVKIN